MPVPSPNSRRTADRGHGGRRTAGSGSETRCALALSRADSNRRTRRAQAEGQRTAGSGSWMRGVYALRRGCGCSGSVYVHGQGNS
jgi:hypothetical protein